ncbi:hypothetical protein [Streptomyces sp. 4F14]|uniref:hypothetical protein n=1 Tax=Streptomyces sp. 4F14 TaxID=3394380 RepID=UPI003A8AAEA4
MRVRRTLTIAGVMLALVGGAAGSAIAAPPPGACTQWCNNPPPGAPRISTQEWNDAVEAADFWANHDIDRFVPRGKLGVGRLNPQLAHGWLPQEDGGRWFDFWNGRAGTDRFIYYGGRFNDRDGTLAGLEQHRGEPSSRAFSTGNGRTAPYVEYDIDERTSSRSQNRGLRRIIRNPLTGNVFATFDHYQTFSWLGEY